MLAVDAGMRAGLADTTNPLPSRRPPAQDNAAQMSVDSPFDLTIVPTPSGDKV